MYTVINTPSKIQKQLAERHKLLRKQQGFTQSGLAERSGVSLGSLKRFEQTGEVSLHTLLKLLHVFNRLDEFDALLQPIEDLSTVEQLFSDDMR